MRRTHFPCIRFCLNPEGTEYARDGRILRNHASKKKGFRKHVMYWVVWFRSVRVGPFVMPCKHARQHNSATGTRTRVARVRAEYPNQLH